MIMKMMTMKSFTTDRYNNRSKAERDFVELFNCLLKCTSCSSSSSSEQRLFYKGPTTVDDLLDNRLGSTVISFSRRIGHKKELPVGKITLMSIKLSGGCAMAKNLRTIE
jgi:hypothetical protein